MPRWRRLATRHQPTPRTHHGAVWTGRELIVWGGEGDDRQNYALLGDGARYDPARDRWTPMSRRGAPSPRVNHVVTWGGGRLLVWGGSHGHSLFRPPRDGALYDPAADAWTPVTLRGAPAARLRAFACWTGSLFFLWGGVKRKPLATGALYDPAADRWIRVPADGAPAGGDGWAFWTGEEALVWTGGPPSFFDPARRRWRTGSRRRAPRRTETAVFTGRQLLCWGAWHYGRPGEGAIYDLEDNAWHPMTTKGAPETRGHLDAAWAGTRMIVWGGYTGDYRTLGNGGAYDPARDRWSRLPTAGAPAPREAHRLVFTGRECLLFGGQHPARGTIESLAAGYALALTTPAPAATPPASPDPPPIEAAAASRTPARARNNTPRSPASR